MRKNVIIFFSTVILLAFSVFVLVNCCESKEFSPFYVVVSSDEKTEKINCWKSGEDKYYVFLPSYAQISETQIYLNTENPVSIEGLPLSDGMLCSDFELEIPYNLVYTSFGKTYKYSITFMHSESVSTMFIDTETGNLDYIHSKKGNEEKGTVSLYKSDGSTDHIGVLESINGRGNNTWEDFDKKPYSIKLENEADLLGMGKAKKWILLANADDTSNLRNKVVYDFADAVNLEYSPDSQWVDLYLNDEYVGLYLLCERNEVHTERVNIAENESFLVSLEFEERLLSQNYTYISTYSGQALRVHYPLETSSESLASLDYIWQSVENAIMANDGIDPVTGKFWLELIDLDSWVRKYLIEEIFGNYDACLISQYFYCDASGNDGKIYAGPVWDYDHSIGNKTTWQLRNPMKLFANRLAVKEGFDTPWFYSLYQKEEFYNRLVEIYQTEFMPVLDELLNKGLNDYTTQISSASVLNQIRWFDEVDNAEKQTDYMRTYMTERLVFLNRIWLENVSYCLVREDSGFGANYAYHAVFYGECLTELPEFEDTETSKFLGWYYSGTDEPFDISKPIYEDTAIYAKWQEKSGEKVKDILKLVPLAVISVLFVAFFVIDIKRNRVAKK